MRFTMASTSDTFFARDREAWRTWLAEHHASAREVWLLLNKKHTGRGGVTLEEAVEEALCFGWIDGKLKRIDDEKHVLRFTPRRPDSIWSASNKARVQRMMEAGRMTDAGLALVEAARRSGQWQLASERENVDALPPDLEEALAQDAKARGNFDAFAPSHKKAYIHWVLEAKRAETRQRRVSEVVRRAALNRRAGA